MNWRSVSAVVVLVLAAGGFYLVFRGPTKPQLEDVVEQWFHAQLERDFEELAKVDAEAPVEREGPAYQAWVGQVSQLLGEYEKERDEGHFEPDPAGRKIARATMVGGGTYWQTLALEGTRAEPVLRIKLNFGYGEIYYGSLPRGSTVYLLGYPLGVVHAIELGTGKEHEITILDHLELRVRLIRARNRAPADAKYKVEKVEWIPESAQYRTVKWLF